MRLAGSIAARCGPAFWRWRGCGRAASGVRRPDNSGCRATCCGSGWVATTRRGLRVLSTAMAGARRRRLTAEQRAVLKERVLAGADLERDAIVAYRILDIRALAEREFGVRYSHGGMHRVLRAIGCAWLMPRPHHPKGDAEAQDEFKKNSRKWSRTSPASIPGSR